MSRAVMEFQVYGSGWQFVEKVWKFQRMSGVGAVAVKDDTDQWVEERFRVRSDWVSPKLEGWAFGDYATYFCPNVFNSRRQKDQCMGGRWLYQDLDEVRPDECTIPPDIWWATSPGRYQALWAMNRALPPLELAPLNKALNRSCGADKGTWNLTRMLRVPGSWSESRECWVTPAFRLMEHGPDDVPEELHHYEIKPAA